MLEAEWTTNISEKCFQELPRIIYLAGIGTIAHALNVYICSVCKFPGRPLSISFCKSFEAHRTGRMVQSFYLCTYAAERMEVYPTRMVCLNLLSAWSSTSSVKISRPPARQGLLQNMGFAWATNEPTPNSY